ncbi:MAG: hypothetical protein AAGG48_32180 [Planctomycetota bacterium]
MFAFSITTFVIAGSDVSTYSWFKQKSWVSAASEKQLIETKRWSTRNGEPPIAVGEAIRLAQPVFERLKDDVDGTYWMLDAVTLHPASPGNPEEPFTDNRWYWEVWYQMYGDSGGSGSWPHIKLIVLMDKTVVEPKLVTPMVPTDSTEIKP